ncbi:MAG TPA: methylated-DNA--[protein]-cysteine S-methyltransferase [Candidatus Limnocylindrales bacterium]|nr:methylated-DNA--[protein]-cysteine S-methyltransferase [Candidatus Limnocylindrales bacterium]
MTTPATNQVAFDTALGRCAVRWSDAGITGVLLPSPTGRPGPTEDERDDAPAFVRRAIEGMRSTLAGQPADLRDVPLDLGATEEMRRRVYEAARRIPAGQVRSYGQVARELALDPVTGARDVGAALARNPVPIIVPCHRIVAANGALHGFSAPGGIATKQRMLELEGAPGYGQQTLFG